MAFFVLLLAAIIPCLLCLSTALLKWNELRYPKKGLPPGTMGWPVFGETTEFLRQGPDFMKNQRSRYGSFFKSHILGSPTVVCMDPDLNRYILANEAKGLVPGYPQSMLDILGKRNIAAVHGANHRYMRGSLLSLVNPAMIKDQLLPKTDQFMRSHLTNWDSCIIDIQEKTKEMALLSSLKQIGGIEPGPMLDEFVNAYFQLVVGTLSLPIDFPGTNYRLGLQARKKMNEMLKKVLQERRASMAKGNNDHRDMLSGLIIGEDNRQKLTDEEIIDQIITVVYSGYETVSTTSMMAVKFLHDNPKILHQIREEHMEIRRRKRPDEPLVWDDLKSMRLTRAVIYETSRLATVVNGVLRKTTQDIELNGFTIPKGWRIYVYTREMNYNPYTYPDPLVFNPWRWLDKSMENSSMIFGAGTRLCPGKELGIVEVSTFLHYFLTQYRWEEVGGEKIMKFPRVMAPKGLHIRVFNLSD